MRLPGTVGILLLSLALTGCGGQLARTGCATVTQVCDNGALRIHYADGKTAWKRIIPDNMPKNGRLAAKHLYKPGRYVETKKGSTLTFPGGDTLVYHDPPCD
jgi:hypothetical protein